ncbi:MAG: 1-acyl-sn-glycerol-3-phosphate acyltransferase [Actinobacteria bacterium]|nr:1-acyl-sn-glycerol-3-phosphate acyltransferase [Actinomycetota bacterium]
MAAPPGPTWFWRLIGVVARVLVRGLLRWRVDVAGLERVPTGSGAVLAFNHHSYVDVVLVAWAIVLQLHRPVRFLAKREMWASPLRPIVHLAGAVPVDRTDASSRHGAYAAAIAALRRGELVAVAPEQTISPSFELLPFRTGAARMAQQAGVPIVPVVGWGTQRCAPKGRRLRWVTRIPVVVRYLEPVPVPADADPVAVTRELQARMEVALREVQDAYPDRPRAGEGWWLPARLGGSAPTHADVLAEHERRFQERRRAAAPDPRSEDRPTGT